MLKRVIILNQVIQRRLLMLSLNKREYLDSICNRRIVKQEQAAFKKAACSCSMQLL